MKTTLYNVELHSDDTLMTIDVEHEGVLANHIGVTKVTWRDLDIKEQLTYEESYYIEDLISDRQEKLYA